MRFLGTAIAAVEWYDNAICIMFADLIADVFFPNCDVNLKFNLYFALVGLGYLGRPLGAYLFGHYSDKVSRIEATMFSFIMMVTASLFISFLPGFNSIGWFAPILFLFFRFLQGMAIGGNYGASIMVLENVSKKDRYFTSSLISTGFMFGFLFGNLVVSSLMYFFDKAFLISYGWRIALWFNLAFALLIIFNFPNQDNFVKVESKASCEKISLKLIFKAFLIILIDGVPFYVFFAFLSNYNTMFLKQDPFFIWLANALAMVTMIIFTPIFGKIADSIGAIKSLQFASLCLIFISFFAPWAEFWWYIVFGFVMSAVYGSLYGWLAMVFPKNIRARASGLLINVAGCISAGVIPLVANKLVGYGVGYLGGLIACISLVVFVILIGENEV